MPNKSWNVTGTLIDSPRMRYHEGTPVTNFRVQVEKSHMEGEQRVADKPEVWAVSAWNRPGTPLAENVAKSGLAKGTRLHVFGNTDDSKPGTAWADHEITARDVSVSMREATVAVTPVQALEGPSVSVAG